MKPLSDMEAFALRWVGRPKTEYSVAPPAMIREYIELRERGCVSASKAQGFKRAWDITPLGRLALRVRAAVAAMKEGA